MMLQENRERGANPIIRTCYACERTYITTKATNPRFCSQNCVDQYDAGLMVGAPEPRLPDGVMLNCPGCGQPFRSRGLGYCKNECVRIHEKKIAAETELAALRETTGVSLPKRGRQCEGPGCNATIPPWTAKGKNRARFCSPKCGRKARQASQAGTGADVAEVGSETAAAQ